MGLYFDGSQANNNVKGNNHLKSKARIKEVLLEMVNANNIKRLFFSQAKLVIVNEALTYDADESLFNIVINADGEETISQLVDMIFSQAILLGVSIGVVTLVMPDDSHLIVDLSLKWNHGYFKRLNLICKELGSITHTMRDINDLLQIYDMVDEDAYASQLDIRAMYLKLGSHLKESGLVNYYSLSADKNNCLVESEYVEV